MRFLRPAVVLVSFGCALASIVACAGDLDSPERFDEPITEKPTASTSSNDASTSSSSTTDSGSSSCGDVPSTIFIPKCADNGCHNASVRMAELDLASPDLRSRLVGKSAVGGAGLLVSPTEPEKSVLYTKLDPVPPFGGVMPSTPLDKTTIACVLEWVVSISK